MHRPQLSIVLPVFNEEESITSLIKEYKKSGEKYDFELICVNNGSTDSTGEKLQQNKKVYQFIKVVTIKKNIGYGHGIMTGIKNSIGDVIAWTHADMQTHPSDVFRAYEVYKRQVNNKTIVKGKRIGRPFPDTFISFWMGVIATFFLRVFLSEINAQPKLFPRSFKEKLTNAPNDFSLDLFFLYKAKKTGYKIKEIPVKFHARIHGQSKWAYSFHSRVKMIVKTLRYIFKLAFA